MSETKNSYNPEVEALDAQEQQWAAMYQEFAVGAAYKELIVAQIDDGMEAVRQRCLDPSVAAIAQVGAQYYRWLLTAERGDPLPEGLVLSEYRYMQPQDAHTQAGRLEVVVDPNDPAAAAGPDGAIKLFERIAITQIGEALKLRYRSNVMLDDGSGIDGVRQQRQEDSAAQFVTSSPLYEYFSLFTQPSLEAAEQKLTPQQQHLRMSQAEQEVKRRHGLDDTDHFTPGSPAWREYHKLTFHLDEAMTQGREQQHGDPKERLRTYVSQLAAQACQDRGYIFQGLGKRESMVGGQQFLYKQQQSDGTIEYHKAYFSDNHNEIAVDVLTRFIDAAGGDDGTPKGMVQNWLYLNVLANINSERTYDDVLRHAASAVQNQLLFRLSCINMIQNTQSAERGVLQALDGMLMTHMLKPTGEIYDKQVYAPRFTVNELLEMAGITEAGPTTIVTKEQFEALGSQSMASVSRRGRAETDTQSRLMLHSLAKESPEQLPLSSSNGELQITLTSPIGKPSAVVGYEVVAYDPLKRTVQYAQSEHDPYTTATVRVFSSQRQQLKMLYEQWGMPDLVAKTHLIETVADIVDMLRQESDYSFDQTAAYPLAGGAPVPVVGGRAQVQCTGAANLLTQSLNTIFEGGQASVIEGYVIEPGATQVSALGHAQVLFSHKNERYVLDATPASSEVLVPGQHAEHTRRNRRQRMVALLKDRRTIKSQPPFIAEDRLPIEVRRDRVVAPKYNSRIEARAAVMPVTATELRSGLEAQLMVALDMPNREDFMKRVSAFRKDDPVRRVMQVAVQSTRQELDVDLPALKQYLDLYADPSNAAALTKHRLPPYEQRTLAVLRRYLDDVERSL